MTTLRNLNRAVQSAEFPSHEWAQAVREWIAEATERMDEASRPRVAEWERRVEPASEGTKVECENCGKATSIKHKYADGQWICASAQPEPAKVECNPYNHHWAWGGCLDCAQPEPAVLIGNEDCQKAKAEGPWLAEVLKPAAPVGEMEKVPVEEIEECAKVCRDVWPEEGIADDARTIDRWLAGLAK